MICAASCEGFLVAVLLSTLAARQAVDTPFTVCFVFFVTLCVCTVTDFSAKDKTGGVKFCTVVHRRLGREYPILENFAAPEAQNRTNLPATAK